MTPTDALLAIRERFGAALRPERSRVSETSDTDPRGGGES